VVRSSLLDFHCPGLNGFPLHRDFDQGGTRPAAGAVDREVVEVDRIVDDGTGHAVRAAPAAAQLGVDDGDDLDPVK